MPVAPEISFIFLRSSWLAADNPRRHKGPDVTERIGAFIYSAPSGWGEVEVESSPQQRGEALRCRDRAAAERLGARLPTPRLTHLGAGGLVRVEIAFFSSTQDTEPTALPRDVTNSN